MKRPSLLRCIVTLLLLPCLSAPVFASAAEAAPLWQIGKADNDTADLALGPKGYQQLEADALYVVGHSEARRDWPYVLPGPSDAWAGSRQHDFAILFALKEKPAAACKLTIDLVDTQGIIPPRLAVLVNGHELAQKQMPKGGGDASVFGDPSKGIEHKLTVEIPAERLVRGTHEITLRSLRGSWVLFDSITFAAPAGTQLGAPPTATAVHAISSAPLLVKRDGRLMQTVRMTVRHFGEPVEALVSLGTAPDVRVPLKQGANTIEVPAPAVDKETAIDVAVRVGEKTLAEREVTLAPVRKWMIYVLPHSHVDIGYTHLQTEVERSHWNYYEQAIEASRRTADYPAGAQFKWNVEVLWATDSYLKQASPEKQKEFIEAVQKGWIGLDALYGNELTALCRPEEMVRLVDYAAQLSQRCGVAIDSAMITDVPGYTWGMVTVLAEAGVKYWSIGPNSGHRIGLVHETWGDKPFWWVGPDGRSRVLVWIPRTGYYRAFTNEEQVLKLVERMEQKDYPYEMLQVRFCMGDNAGPAVGLSDLVKDWNAKYAYPRLVISTTSEMMRDFEKHYGRMLPEVRGDFTPYWEDGAASSALETGLNRAAAERLSQAEALCAILRPKAYPADAFYAAWREAILYDEHTWGAHNSISQPDSEFAKGQWAIKQAFAREADRRSRALLAEAVKPVARQLKAGERTEAVLVFNASSWPRTDLVVLPKGTLAHGAVTDAKGNHVPWQRLADGRVAVLVEDVPPLGAKKILFSRQSKPFAAYVTADIVAKAEGNRLSNGLLELAIDEQTGAARSLKAKGLDAELVDASSGLGLNAYRYVAGRSPDSPQPNGPVTIRVGESGPLVASLIVESAAPGCRRLVREYRVTAREDHVEVLNVIDKEKVRDKEAVHLGFAFGVPDGVMRVETPLAVVRPEEDQLDGACKNYLTVSRFVDVSNAQYGVTWATLDAPLIEVGAIRMDVPGPFGLAGWVKHLEPSQTLYSYAMNNYWETNYKADQEGPTPFRYAIRPHRGGYDGMDAARFGVERSQPLVAVPAGKDAPNEITSRLRLDWDDVLVTAFKPSRHGKALIVRLYGASGEPRKVSLAWSDPQPTRVCLSDFTETCGKEIAGPVEVPGYGLVTLRAELP